MVFGLELKLDPAAARPSAPNLFALKLPEGADSNPTAQNRKAKLYDDGLMDKMEAESHSHLYRISLPAFTHMGAVGDSWFDMNTGTSNATNLLFMLEDMVFDDLIVDKYQLNEDWYYRGAELLSLIGQLHF